MDEIEKAKSALRALCGLNDNEPTNDQLKLIAYAALRQARLSGGISEDELKQIIAGHCKSYGQYKRASINPSGLIDAVDAVIHAMGIK
ncbi:MAG: hypothetical protein HYX59_09910 [Elusimicrobia bacterium]|nr:hypothetical protein [Elusimicrobiota bacterium]